MSRTEPVRPRTLSSCEKCGCDMHPADASASFLCFRCQKNVYPAKSYRVPTSGGKLRAGNLHGELPDWVEREDVDMETDPPRKSVRGDQTGPRVVLPGPRQCDGKTIHGGLTQSEVDYFGLSCSDSFPYIACSDGGLDD